MKFCVFTFLFLLLPNSITHADFLEKNTHAFEESQNDNTYAKLIARLALNSKSFEEIYTNLITIFYQIKALPYQERVYQWSHILKHWSKANNLFKPSALGFEDKIKYTLESIFKNQFSPETLTKELLGIITAYELELTTPLLHQVAQQIDQVHKGKIVLCLGRDFTTFYLLKHLTGKGEHIYNLNISRDIKDLIFSGEHQALLELLSNLGITAERIKEHGLVILDSSMKGKIPKSVITSLTYSMGERESFELISNHIEIMYANTRNYNAGDLRNQAVQIKKQNGDFSLETRKQLLDEERRIWIQLFDLEIPAPYTTYPAESVHHLFEHRLKSVLTATKFNKNRNGILTSEDPTHPYQRARMLLGSYADMQLTRIIKNTGVFKLNPKKTRKPKKPKTYTGKVNSLYLTTLDKIYKNSESSEMETYTQLRQWQDERDERLESIHQSTQIVEHENSTFPYTLEIGGEVIYRFKKYLSRGRNGLVFLSEYDTAVKVAIQPSGMKRNILQSWMEPKLKKFAIRYSKILNAHPNGVFIETDHVPGEDLQYQYTLQEKELPYAYQVQIIQQWNAALKLGEESGLWIDFKAANYHVGKNGKITLVDFAPRLNKGRTVYFYYPRTTNQLGTRDFLDEFMQHEVRKGNARKTPGVACHFSFQQQEYKTVK